LKIQFFLMCYQNYDEWWKENYKRENILYSLSLYMSSGFYKFGSLN